MRVLALGGCGEMGRYACRVAARLPGVDELVVTDLDGSRAAAFAAELGHPARPAALDITDGPSLASALREADVVLNTAGPFFRFGIPVLAAAIRARCHYLDICDDWEPTAEMFALHEQALRAGRSAIIGMGASPGISNILAVIAARELDVTHEIVTGWNLDGARSEQPAGGTPSAALVHGLRQMTGTIRVVREGRPRDERPLRRTVLDYPGLGRRHARTIGHPEPLTLLGSFPRLESSVNVTFGSPSTLAAVRAVTWAADRNLLSRDRALRALSWLEAHTPALPPARLFRPGRLPPLFALASGLRDGRPASAAAALRRVPGTTMGALTGVPLATALELLLAGQVTKSGVLAPETALEPGNFLSALAAHCPGPPGAAEMTAITRSWEPQARASYRSAVSAASRSLG